MRGSFLTLALLPALTFAAATPKPADANDDHVKVSLVAEQNALVPGTTAWIGLRFEHEPHWHTYWINPGDSGLPTKVTWQLPAGYSAGEIAWPAPTRIAVGDLANFGFSGDALFPLQIEVPRDAREGDTAHLSAEVRWLVCRDECVPGKATVSLDLPVHAITATNPNYAHRFDAARAAAPQTAAWTGVAHLDGGSVEVTLRNTGIADSQTVDAFAIDRKVVANAAPKITRRSDSLEFAFKKSEYFESAPARFNLIVRTGDGPAARAWRVSVPFDAAPISPSR